MTCCKKVASVVPWLEVKVIQVMFPYNCSKVGLRLCLGFLSKTGERYTVPLLQGVWGMQMEKSIFVPAEASTSKVSANDLILRSIWYSSSSQAFAVSDITYRSVILCNPQNQQKHQLKKFLEFPSQPAIITLNLDDGVLQVVVSYMSLRAILLRDKLH